MDIPGSYSQDCATSRPLIDVNSQLFKRGHEVLRLLHDAYCYADHHEQHDCDVWDFAEEIGSLRQLGLTNGDLRWLVCIGYLEHGHESTEIGDERRKFQRDEGLYFSEKTCFVLSDVGASHIKGLLIAPAADGPQIHPDFTAAKNTNRPLNPRWSSDLREFTVGNTIVKRFMVPARNQEIILTVFQEENWSRCIDDPLPPDPEIDSKRRLRDTVNSLNRNQKNKLVHFHVTGCGEKVRWELSPNREFGIVASDSRQTS